MLNNYPSINDKTNPLWADLIRAASFAREKAYAPYSKFKVGACVLTDTGELYQGANVENASFGATICAERTAIFKAVLEGNHKIKALALIGAKAYTEKGNIDEYCFPCGICRQVLSEFADPDTVILVAKNEADFQLFTFADLLPHSFDNEFSD